MSAVWWPDEQLIHTQESTLKKHCSPAPHLLIAFLFLVIDTDLSIVSKRKRSYADHRKCRQQVEDGEYDIDHHQPFQKRTVDKAKLIYLHQKKMWGEILAKLGFNSHQLAVALGNLVARMAFPASELVVTIGWEEKNHHLADPVQ